MADPWAAFRDKPQDGWSQFREGPVGWLEDSLRAIPGQLGAGVTDLLASGGDAAQQLVNMALPAARAMGLNPSADDLRTARTAVAAGLAGRSPISTEQIIGLLGGQRMNWRQAEPLAQARAVTSPQANAARQAVMGTDYQPQTPTGKVAGAVARAAPSAALVPGGIGARAAQTVIPAATGEGARQVAEGAGLGPGAQVAAQLGGGLVGGGVSSLFGRQPVAEARLADAMDGFSADDVTAANRLVQQAASQGIRLGFDEALAQVAPGRAKPLQTLVRATGQTPRGAAALTESIADRPQEVRAATMAMADRFAPPPADPARLGLDVQRAAETALNTERARINALATPHYDALQGQALPGAVYQSFAQDPSYQAAQNALRENAELAPLLTRQMMLEPANGGPPISMGAVPLPDNDLSVINRVVQQLDTMGENARVSPTNPGGNNTLAGQRQSARDLVDQAIRSADETGITSGDWTRARQIVSEGRAATLEPMQAGPLGTMVASADPHAQAMALFPRNPTEGYRTATQGAMDALAGQNPSLPAQLVRNRWVDQFNTSSRDLQGGPKWKAGADFAVALTGNPEQALVFREGVARVAPEAADEVDSLIAALRATGTREHQGSPTAAYAQQLEDLSAGEAPMEALKGAARPWTVPDRVGNWMDRQVLNHNAEALVRALTGSDDFEAQHRRLSQGRANRYSRELARTLAASFGASRPTIEEAR